MLMLTHADIAGSGLTRLSWVRSAPTRSPTQTPIWRASKPSGSNRKKPLSVKTPHQVARLLHTNQSIDDAF